MKKTFEGCTPCNKEKAKFYKKLVKFYNLIIELVNSNAIEVNSTQVLLADDIRSFLDGKYITSTCNDYALIALDGDMVSKMRPIRKDKVAIYNCLVLFMEATLNKVNEMLVSDVRTSPWFEEVYGSVPCDALTPTTNSIMESHYTAWAAHADGLVSDGADLALDFIKEKGLYDEYIKWLKSHVRYAE